MIAYCLLPNHYHLLVRQQRDVPAELLPQRVFNSYTKAYDNRYEHRGTLFEGRYKVVHVVSDSHLRHLCRYIHNNPVKDIIVDNLVDWPFSNYPEWIGLRQGTMVDFEFIEAFFENGSTYREFVDDYLTIHQLPRKLEFLK